MSRSVGFGLQFAATAAGALLDYFIGKLTGTLSLGIASWAALILVAATVLEFSKELVRERHSPTTPYSGSAFVFDFWRPWKNYRWGTFVRAVAAAGLAGLASCAFILAFITFRFVATYNGPQLGRYSPFNAAVIVFVSNFQASVATAALIIGSFALGVLLRSEFLLPFGICFVSIANALLIGLPQQSATSAVFRSQIAYSLSAPDGLLFKLPVVALPWACAIPFVVGIIVCGMVSSLVRT